MAARTHIFHRHRKNRKYSKKKSHVLIDRWCLVGSIINPLSAAPQIYQLYSTQETAGLSLLMWIFYGLAAVPFILYGITHRELPITILNSAWLAVSAIMVIGIIVF